MHDMSTHEQALRQRQGDAVREVLARLVWRHHGLQRPAGDFLVTCLPCPLQGWWEPLAPPGDGLPLAGLRWADAAPGVLYLAVVVCDVDDGRFIPHLDVEVALSDPDGHGVGVRRHPFVWHPLLHHYGAPWPLPRDGYYHLRVRIAPPGFPRLHRDLGMRFHLGADVLFPNVYLAPQGLQGGAA